MTVIARKSLRLASALAIALVFVLSSCKIDGTIEVKADGGTKIDLTFEDSDGKMAEIDNSCEGLRLSIEAKMTFVKEPKVEDITPSDGRLTCRLTSNKPLGGRVRFTESKDTFFFFIPDMKDNSDYSNFRTSVVVKMPGKVIKSNRGRIEDNKVIINSFDFFAHGISVTAKKNTSSSSVTPKPSCSTCGKDASAPSSENGGFPMWGWALVGAGVCVVVVGAVVAVTKRRRGRRSAVGPYPLQGGR